MPLGSEVCVFVAFLDVVTAQGGLRGDDERARHVGQASRLSRPVSAVRGAGETPAVRRDA